MPFFIQRNGERFGPYTEEELQRYKAEGRIADTDKIVSDGADQSIRIEEIPIAPAVDEFPAGIRAEVRTPAPSTGGKRWWGVWLGVGVAVVVIAIAIAVSAAIAAARAPERSLDQARMAYLNRDAANFDKYVDVASVLGDWTDQAVEVFLTRTQAGTLETAAARALLPYVKNAFLPAASQSVDQFIISGTLSDDPQAANADPTSAYLASYVSNAMRQLANSQLSYGGVESQSISGDTALLDVKVMSPSMSDPLILKVRMQKMDNYWKIVAILDLGGLMSQLVPPAAPAEAPAPSADEQVAQSTPPAQPAEPVPDFDSLPVAGSTQPDAAPAPPESAPPAPAPAPSEPTPVTEPVLITVRVCVPLNLVQNESWDSPQTEQMTAFRAAARDYIDAHGNAQTAFRIRDVLINYDPATTPAGDLLDTIDAGEACGDGYKEYTLDVDAAPR